MKDVLHILHANLGKSGGNCVNRDTASLIALC